MSREREFLEYVLSSMLAMIGQSIYILADTYFVAKGLGANGLAALNLAIPIYNFINGVGLMIGIGGATRFIISHIPHGRRRRTLQTDLYDSCNFRCTGRTLFFSARSFLCGSSDRASRREGGDL